MFNHCLACLFVALLGLALPAGAAEVAPATAATAATAAEPAAGVRSCPVPAAVNLTQTSQTDCCKGHKGVCGCRAGKIVCCDGTISANCACHGDDGLLN